MAKNWKKGYQPWWDTAVELRAYSKITIAQIAKAVNRAPITVARFVTSPYYKKAMSKIQKQREKMLEKQSVITEQRILKFLNDSMTVAEDIVKPGARGDRAIRARVALDGLKGRGVLPGKLDVSIRNEGLHEFVKTFRAIRHPDVETMRKLVKEADDVTKKNVEKKSIEKVE